VYVGSYAPVLGIARDKCKTANLMQVLQYLILVIQILFGPKRDGVTGGQRKLHNEELHNL
jgi:hypothetical protein